MTPFWDSVGVAMINECEADDIRIICRPGHAEKYLKEGIPLRFNQDLHTKMLIGDRATLMGSFNMTYQSMFDNLEQATFSRSQQYAKLFISEWDRLFEPQQPQI